MPHTDHHDTYVARKVDLGFPPAVNNVVFQTSAVKTACFRCDQPTRLCYVLLHKNPSPSASRISPSSSSALLCAVACLSLPRTMLNAFKIKPFDLEPVFESWSNPPVFVGNPKKDPSVDAWLESIKAGCVERKVPEEYWHKVDFYRCPLGIAPCTYLRHPRSLNTIWARKLRLGSMS